MDKVEFKRLVEYVRHSFVDHRRDLCETPAKAWAYSYRILLERGRGDFLQKLLSGSGKLEWDALSLIAQEHLRAGTELPPEITTWIIDVLAGEKPRPTKGARDTSGRNRMIYGAVWFMPRRFDLPATRNATDGPKCCAKGASACDVVGAAAAVTFKTAEQAWTFRDPLLS